MYLSNNSKDSWRPYHELSDLSVSVSDILTAQYFSATSRDCKSVESVLVENIMNEFN